MEAGDRSLAVVPCAVYRFSPDAVQRFGSVVPGTSSAALLRKVVGGSVGTRHPYALGLRRLI
jgi:hypothetical protein